MIHRLMSRRIFAGGLASSGLLIASGAKALADRPATAESPMGPFYPIVRPADSDSDLTELDSLSNEELVLVADGLDLPLTELEIPEEAPLSDLDTIQLGRILRSLEG